MHAYEKSSDELELAREEWEGLQMLLGGGTLRDLEKAASQRRHEADQLTIANGLEIEEISQVKLEEDVEAQFDRLIEN